jgi:hypothetical protein
MDRCDGQSNTLEPKGRLAVAEHQLAAFLKAPHLLVATAPLAAAFRSTFLPKDHGAPHLAAQHEADQPAKFVCMWLGGVRASGTRLSGCSSERLALEPELCLTLSEPVAADAGVERARAAIAYIQPAFELVDYTKSARGLNDIVEHSMFHSAIVVGEPVPLPSAQIVAQASELLTFEVAAQRSPAARPGLVPFELAEIRTSPARHGRDASCRRSPDVGRFRRKSAACAPRPGGHGELRSAWDGALLTRLRSSFTQPRALFKRGHVGAQDTSADCYEVIAAVNRSMVERGSRLRPRSTRFARRLSAQAQSPSSLAVVGVVNPATRLTA